MSAHTHHITSLPALFATFAALIFLTFITVLLAAFDLGELDMVVTLSIAVVKAALVALVFMQLMYDKVLNSVILVGSLLFVALFLGIALMDSLEYQPQITGYVQDNPPAPVTETAE